jgi:hypothetical protein
MYLYDCVPTAELITSLVDLQTAIQVHSDGCKARVPLLTKQQARVERDLVLLNALIHRIEDVCVHHFAAAHSGIALSLILVFTHMHICIFGPADGAEQWSEFITHGACRSCFFTSNVPNTRSFPNAPATRCWS